MATVAPERPRTSAPAPAAIPDRDVYWVVSGVAGELARRLRASATFIRVVVILAGVALGWPVIAAYAAAALLLPQGGRPLAGWRNLVALSRLGFLILMIVSLQGLSLDKYGVFGQGPAVWVPFGAVLLAGAIALFGTGRWAGESDDERDRRLLIASLPALALAAAVGIGMLVAPAVRWELVLDLGLVAGGVVLAWSGRRDVREMPVIPYLALALLAVVLAASGARLEGGMGDTRAAPRDLAALRPVYRRAIGDETLDLSALRGPGVVRVDASVGIGNLTITLPADADGSVDLRVGSGGWNADLTASPQSGFDLHRVLPVRPVGRPARRPALRLRIRAEVGRGCLIIARSGDDYSSGGSCS